MLSTSLQSGRSWVVAFRKIQMESACTIIHTFQQYAFAHHALRELRVHASTRPDDLESAAGRGLAGRTGQEHCRAAACDIIQRQAHWPFHLAGDSGVRLFEHRAWLSWRYVALLEVPTLTFCEHPALSMELQCLIETTRSNVPHVDRLSEHDVETVLLAFFQDPWDSHAKARWLRWAMKLPARCEDDLVVEQLQRAVADCFAMLQSLSSGTQAIAVFCPTTIHCMRDFVSAPAK